MRTDIISSLCAMVVACAACSSTPANNPADSGAGDAGGSDTGTGGDTGNSDGGTDGGRTGCDAGPFDDGGGTVLKGVNHVLLAWNDLGMHCLNPAYEYAVILPPYNTMHAQVVEKGAPPKVITSGLSVGYRIVGNTFSYCKGDYGSFWDNSVDLFGITMERDTGLNLVTPALHNGLSGDMIVGTGNGFEVDGMPVVPVNDIMAWNPFQVAELTLKSGGTILAQTRATVPTSDEINCAKCHGADALRAVLAVHDQKQGTTFIAGGKPVLCASCHGSPALGQTGPGPSGKYLSGVVHAYHADKGASCYDCHPGDKTRCSRSLKHTATDGNCTTCHGTMADVGGSVNSGTRIPWVQEPACSTCHTGVPGVDTGGKLYRNSMGHGGLACEACHGSPHAMVPSRESPDNYQANQYQGKAVALGSCRSCHTSSRGGGDIADFAEKHGGANPEKKTACNTCHTAVPVPTDTSKWPHQFGWKSRN